MSQSDDRDSLTRRRFLQQGASLAALAPIVINLGACASSDDAPEKSSEADAPGPKPETKNDAAETGASEQTALPIAEGDTLPEGAVLMGLTPGDAAAAMGAALSRLDFSWLKEGDSVLIKVASNSGNPHPATTSPAGVRAMALALKERGAGRVIVADQAGVEHVRRSAKGRYSSTRERFQTNGLGALEDVAELHYFDEGDWDSGYFQATLPEGHHWPRGMYLAGIIKEVDHIVYMPRISAHILAGLTNAQKSAIGWLRDDSRHDLHNDAQNFYEKYAEISYTEEIASRFRMVVTFNEQVQLFGGPDMGTAYTLNPPLVLASTSLANHDAVATSVLVTLQQKSGARASGMTYSGALAPTLNTFFAGGAGVSTGPAGTWVSGSPSSRYTAHAFETKVDGERAVARGWSLTGDKPSDLPVVVAGEGMDAMLRTGLESHGQGLYALKRFGA